MDDGRGFGMAINAFVGQNYGAKQYGRMKKGYFIAAGMMTAWGALITVIMLTFSTPTSACSSMRRTCFPTEPII